MSVAVVYYFEAIVRVWAGGAGRRVVVGKSGDEGLQSKEKRERLDSHLFSH